MSGPVRHDVVLTETALQHLATMPARFSGPVLEFIDGTLARRPTERGLPLASDLSGRWSARLGDFRVLYRVDEERSVVQVLAVGYRNEGSDLPFVAAQVARRTPPRAGAFVR